MWKHALHLYLEELETMDSTFSGGHLPGVHSGCGSPLRVGITETGGKRGLHHWFYLFFYFPAHLRLPIFTLDASGLKY